MRCNDAIGLAKGRASGLQKFPATAIPKSLLLKTCLNWRTLPGIVPEYGPVKQKPRVCILVASYIFDIVQQMTKQIRLVITNVCEKYRCSVGANSPESSEEIDENDETAVSEHEPYDTVVHYQNHPLPSGISNRHTG